MIQIFHPRERERERGREREREREREGEKITQSLTLIREQSDKYSTRRLILCVNI